MRLLSDDTDDVGEAPSAEGLTFYSQTASLVEANPAWAMRVTKDPVLVAQVVDDGLRLSIDPA